MTQINREELIEIVAGNQLVINECRAYDSKCGSVDAIVEEVLKAIGEYLPDSKDSLYKLKDKGSGIMMAEDLYTQFKDICEV